MYLKRNNSPKSWSIRGQKGKYCVKSVGKPFELSIPLNYLLKKLGSAKIDKKQILLNEKIITDIRTLCCIGDIIRYDKEYYKLDVENKKFFLKKLTKDTPKVIELNIIPDAKKTVLPIAGNYFRSYQGYLAYLEAKDYEKVKSLKYIFKYTPVFKEQNVKITSEEITPEKHLLIYIKGKNSFIKYPILRVEDKFVVINKTSFSKKDNVIEQKESLDKIGYKFIILSK